MITILLSLNVDRKEVATHFLFPLLYYLLLYHSFFFYLSINFQLETLRETNAHKSRVYSLDLLCANCKHKDNAHARNSAGKRGDVLTNTPRSSIKSR